MNKFMLLSLLRYNKASIAGLAQVLVQVVASFVAFEPQLEQALGVVLTAFLVWIVPNRNDLPTQNRKDGQKPPDVLIAHSPAIVAIAALAFGLFP